MLIMEPSSVFIKVGSNGTVYLVLALRNSYLSLKELKCISSEIFHKSSTFKQMDSSNVNRN